MEKIRIKYFTDKIEKLDYIEGKSDWIDVRASEEVTLHAGDFALIPLGIAMELQAPIPHAPEWMHQDPL